MKYISGEARGQMTLMPDSIEEYVGESSPVRVIDAFVDGLDIGALGFVRAKPAETGRPSYDPRDLLKLYVYGYFNKIRSSRMLQRECRRNVEVMYLLNRLAPDFRTISDFRKDNTKALRGVFTAFVKLCMKLKLYQKELLAVDGSKFRASNSKDNCYTAEVLAKKIATIDKHIAEYLTRLDERDREESAVPEASANEIKQAISDLRERKEKYEGYARRVESSGDKQLLTTDPEARRMHSKDGFHCSYNVLTAVDDGSHLIAEYEVTNHNNDTGLLCDMGKKVKDMLETETIHTVADKGFDSREDIQKCVENGVIPTVALKYDKDESVFAVEYAEAEITDEVIESTKPEDIQTCLRAGILPKCYEGSGISVEVQKPDTVSCFIYNDDETVTCPTGQILSRVKEKGNSTVYANKGACRTCQNRCTSSKNFKTVSFGAGTDCVPVMMSGGENIRCGGNLQQIPENARISPNNHTLDRRDYRRPKQVLLHVKMDAKTVKRRKCVVEHPFGTVKWTHGAHYVLCRGKEKVTAELGLSFLAYNLRRVMSIFAERHAKHGRPDWTAGIAALISAIRTSQQPVSSPLCENKG